jgi:hypothetical protein
MMLVSTTTPETRTVTRRRPHPRRARDAPLRVVSRGRMVGRLRLEMRTATLPGAAARECNRRGLGPHHVSEMPWIVGPDHALIKRGVSCSTKN